MTHNDFQQRKQEILTNFKNQILGRKNGFGYEEAAHQLDELFNELLGDVEYPQSLSEEPGEFTGTIETLNEVRKYDAQTWSNTGRNKLRASVRKVITGDEK